ncbi:MAG: SEC-C domain-containing protein [bacterium]|nr:SEC-C domain-containing protein [bacterium]
MDSDRQRPDDSVMARTRRNASCPCGSGNKYKHCCIQSDAEAQRERARHLRLETKLTRQAIQWALDKHGNEKVYGAWNEFTACLLDPTSVDIDDPFPFARFFFLWWLFGGSRETKGGPSPMSEYLDHRGTPEDAFERRLVRSIEAAPFSFYRVGEVDPKRSMVMHDLLTGQRRVVLEQHVDARDAQTTCVFARVAVVDGVAGVYGVGPLAIDPSWVPQIESLRNSRSKLLGRPLTMDDLHEIDAEIRWIYMACLEQSGYGHCCPMCATASD